MSTFPSYDTEDLDFAAGVRPRLKVGSQYASGALPGEWRVGAGGGGRMPYVHPAQQILMSHL